MAESVRVGLGFLGEPGLADLARLGRVAEATGYASLWFAETQNRRDAVTAAATLLQATRRVTVGAAGINVYTRAAGLVGVTAATLAESYGSRLVVGLGVGSGSTLRQLGVEVTHPIGRLREYVDVVRTVAAGGGRYRGRYATVDDLVTGAVVTEQPAVYLCVGGPQALRLAAATADGVLLDLFLPPSAVATQRRVLHDGADGGYRGAVAVSAVVAVDEDVGQAAARVRPLLARYLTAFPELVRELGVDQALVDDVDTARREHGDAAVAKLLTDDLVDEFAVCGTAQRCRRRLARYVDAGATELVLFPGPGSLSGVAADRTLAQGFHHTSPGSGPG